jgi:hypothetical protein
VRHDDERPGARRDDERPSVRHDDERAVARRDGERSGARRDDEWGRGRADGPDERGGARRSDRDHDEYGHRAEGREEPRRSEWLGSGRATDAAGSRHADRDRDRDRDADRRPDSSAARYGDRDARPSRPEPDRYESSWTEERLRGYLRPDSVASVGRAAPGRAGDGWSAVGDGDRWAEVRLDERGARELRIGERREERRVDETGTHLRIVDSWSTIREEPVRPHPGTDDRGHRVLDGAFRPADADGRSRAESADGRARPPSDARGSTPASDDTGETRGERRRREALALPAPRDPAEDDRGWSATPRSGGPTRRDPADDDRGWSATPRSGGPARRDPADDDRGWSATASADAPARREPARPADGGFQAFGPSHRDSGRRDAADPAPPRSGPAGDQRDSGGHRTVGRGGYTVPANGHDAHDARGGYPPAQDAHEPRNGHERNGHERNGHDRNGQDRNGHERNGHDPHDGHDPRNGYGQEPPRSSGRPPGPGAAPHHPADPWATPHAATDDRDDDRWARDPNSQSGQWSRRLEFEPTDDRWR